MEAQLLPYGFDAEASVKAASHQHSNWSEAYIAGQPGANDLCAYCCMQYSEKRKYGGFIALADPIYQPGITTLYGCECCRVCYQMLANMNISERFKLLFTAQAYSSRPYYSYSIMVAAREQGQYPPEMPCKPLKLRPGFDRTQKLSAVECVHVSLIRWKETKGAPNYSADRFKRSKYSFV